MKKIFSVFAIVFTAMMLVACGEQNEDRPTETVELTVYSQMANSRGVMGGWFAQLMLEKFNVKLNLIPDDPGVYTSLMQSGDLGDLVVWGDDGDEYKNAIEAGLLLDWDEFKLLDQKFSGDDKSVGYYIKENMGRALDKNREISGGKLYGFGHNVAPSADSPDSFFYTWDIRWDLYDQLGRPQVKDLNALVNVFKDMKALQPKDDAGNETYALSIWHEWDGTMVMYVKALATAYYGYDELQMGLYNPDNGEYYPTLQQGGPYLEMLKFFYDLNQAGLLDPASRTQTFDEMSAKVANGGTLFSIFDYAGSTYFNTQANVANNRMMLPLVPEDARPIVYGLNPMGGNRVWTIGSKTKHAKLVMEILNWLSTPEGRLTAEYGPKGITWDYDENGKTYATELGHQFQADKNSSFPADSPYQGTFNAGDFEINNTTWALSSINPESGEPYDYKLWESNQVGAKNEIEAKWRTANGVNIPQEYLANTNYRLAIGSAYSATTRDSALTLKWDSTIDIIKTYSRRAMFAKDLNEYNYIVNEMRREAIKVGYNDTVAWSQQEAVRRFEAENKVRNK